MEDADLVDFRVMRKSVACACCAVLTILGLQAGEGEIVFSKQALRWLWGGLGFHNSEATMLGIMSDEFRDERALKSFREISPTFTRLFIGYADWSRAAMDSFADYYDLTFRRAGTTIYAVPGRMAYMDKDFNADAYAEKVAANLEYLIVTRHCTKLRYYCLSNECSMGNTWSWFCDHLDLFKECSDALYRAFRRHGLGVGLVATDASGYAKAHLTRWATQNMDDITDLYSWHLYGSEGAPGDWDYYKRISESLADQVAIARTKEKRYTLGEYGIGAYGTYPSGHEDTMRSDLGRSFADPATAPLTAIMRAEMAIAAINAGCESAANWTFVDYPDPFLREDGDTPEEKARYEVSRFSGHGTRIRYNKWGLFRWSDETKDYSAYPELYTMGYMAKLFRKGARVLTCATDDHDLRACGVTNPDGSASFAVINWGAAKDLKLSVAHDLAKPLRVYEYDSAHVPENACNDLQPAKGTVAAKDGVVTVRVPARSLTLLTTDYVDRVPSTVSGVEVKDGRLAWGPVEDADHVYYRVFAGDRQLRSTVACSCAVDGLKGPFAVRSVDRWGNVGK